ncbi:MAG TPA: PilN domain-containing protein [Tepidisphaeraceae bacterium]|jgi:Tfp pilus assembly protein PilN
MTVNRGVNLIPSTRREARHRRTRLRCWIGAGIAWAGLVASVCVGVHLSLLGNDYTATAGELTGVREHVSDLNNRLAETRRDLMRAEVGRQTAQTLSDQPDWSLLLSILGQAVGDEVVLRELQLKPLSDPKSIASQRGFEVQLRGFSRSQPQVSRFVLRLQQVGLFDEVKLQRTGREPVLNTSAVTFDINCTIQQDGAQPGSRKQ